MNLTVKPVCTLHLRVGQGVDTGHLVGAACVQVTAFILRLADGLMQCQLWLLMY